MTSIARARWPMPVSRVNCARGGDYVIADGDVVHIRFNV